MHKWLYTFNAHTHIYNECAYISSIKYTQWLCNYYAYIPYIGKKTSAIEYLQSIEQVLWAIEQVLVRIFYLTFQDFTSIF